MRVLIYEYFSAGGEQDGNDLLVQGFAMLNALLQDFFRLEDIILHTVLHPQLRKQLQSAPYARQLSVQWEMADSKDPKHTFEKALQGVDAVLIVAPEGEEILYQLTRLAESNGKLVLGSNSESICVAGNKETCTEVLRQGGIRVPRTISLRKQREMKRPIPIPFVVKPVYGAGGHGVRLVESTEEGERLLSELADSSSQGEKQKSQPEEKFLLQDYIPGEAVSVSCLVANGKVLPLTLNQQLLTFDKGIDFKGVKANYQHLWEQEGKEIAKAACESIPGLQGFVGVDLVLNPEGPFVIEVNPRITLAYPALQSLFPDIAQYILKACLHGELPVMFPIVEEAIFLVEEAPVGAENSSE